MKFAVILALGLGVMGGVQAAAEPPLALPPGCDAVAEREKAEHARAVRVEALGAKGIAVFVPLPAESHELAEGGTDWPLEVTEMEAESERLWAEHRALKAELDQNRAGSLPALEKKQQLMSKLMADAREIDSRIVKLKQRHVAERALALRDEHRAAVRAAGTEAERFALAVEELMDEAFLDPRLKGAWRALSKRFEESSIFVPPQRTEVRDALKLLGRRARALLEELTEWHARHANVDPNIRYAFEVRSPEVVAQDIARTLMTAEVMDSAYVARSQEHQGPDPLGLGSHFGVMMGMCVTLPWVLFCPDVSPLLMVLGAIPGGFMGYAGQKARNSRRGSHTQLAAFFEGMGGGPSAQPTTLDAVAAEARARAALSPAELAALDPFTRSIFASPSPPGGQATLLLPRESD